MPTYTVKAEMTVEAPDQRAAFRHAINVIGNPSDQPADRDGAHMTRLVIGEPVYEREAEGA